MDEIAAIIMQTIAGAIGGGVDPTVAADAAAAAGSLD